MLKKALIAGFISTALTGCLPGEQPSNSIATTTKPASNKIDSIKKGMEVIGRDSQGRLANVMAYRLNSRGSSSLNSTDLEVLDVMNQEMQNDFTEDRYYKNMRIFGFANEMIKQKDSYILRNRWALDAAKGSVFEKAFPRGAKLAFHEEAIPKNPNCKKPLVIVGELYPRNSKPIGLSVEEEVDSFRIKFDSTPSTVYQHRALLDVGCIVPVTKEEKAKSSASKE
jgi:hypothetical protein